MRLDQYLTAHGLAESRARAQAAIRDGAVHVDGRAVRRPAFAVPETARVEILGETLPWVSRAALKLVHALDTFGLSPRGEALDVGASTGGFTEVLLARGAARVHALDVGHGQLHPRIAADARVRSLEGVNARAIPEGLVPPVDWVVSDVSFIGLEKALPGPLALARPGGRLVALIKPQFEAGPEHVGRGGIVRDPGVQAACRARIARFLEASGWQVTGEAESPITGSDGNREFLVTAVKATAGAPVDL
ncbi:TlyA family RNA methyltransferase [Paroceanicella profunda]|uniref:TlyA family RNA methyltransferase n=1 Tax=Paroceanicella profunda TaxID=2579971 RepID=A0A5B8FYX7_9RHOB|nr:TlyA family RNA methyltransferase [Paroceanicella profunda]QDL91413.1 TlyA family RNA methyltransferase [Paroceanicella profunda]